MYHWRCHSEQGGAGHGKEPALQSIYLQPPDKWWHLGNPEWVGTLTVQYKLAPTLAMETVPAERSAPKVVGKLVTHGRKEGESYDHQNSYANNNVLASMLYSIAKIAGTAKWD